MKKSNFSQLKLILFITVVAWLSEVSDILLLLRKGFSGFFLQNSQKLTQFTRLKFEKLGMTIDEGLFLKLINTFKETQDEIQLAWYNSYSTRLSIQRRLIVAYNYVPHSDLILTAFGTLSAAWFIRRSLHRYRTANELPLSFFQGKRQKKLKGLAVSVNDSDNIRFYHQPHLFSLFKPSLARQDLKFNTINVRLAGIDAPEMAHFGTKPQPFATEAKEWLIKFVQGRKVCIQLHRIDQYGRAVATVWVHRRKFPWFWWPVWWNVSLEMVRAGYATIYRDLGAEYNGILKDLEGAELRARRLKLGMWTQSKEEYQSPGDFKRANRLQASLQKSQNTKIDFISEQTKLKTSVCK